MRVQLQWAEGSGDGEVTHVGPTTFTVQTGTPVEWHFDKAAAIDIHTGITMRPLPRLLSDGTVGSVGPTLWLSAELCRHLRTTEPQGPDRYQRPVTREEALARVAQGWLLFHGGDWGPEQVTAWEALGFGSDCTSKVLGDAARKALAMPSPVKP